MPFSIHMSKGMTTLEKRGNMPFSIELELTDGGHVIYDNVVSYVVEEITDAELDDESDYIETEIAAELEAEAALSVAEQEILAEVELESEPSPDEVPEEGEEERTGNLEPDEVAET